MGYREIGQQARHAYELYSVNAEYQPSIEVQYTWIKIIERVLRGSHRTHWRRQYVFVEPDPFRVDGLPPVVMWMWKPYMTMGEVGRKFVIELGGIL